MMLMAIDHTAMAVGGYAHGQGRVNEEPSTIIRNFSDTLPFVLRTLTHLCAPGFSMLMGMGLAYWISSRVKRGQTFSEMASHLLSRALAIVILNEVTFIFAIFQGLWLINAVLVALAVDYVLIGFLGAALTLWIEPSLASSLASFLADDEEDVDAAEAAAAVGMRPPPPRKSGRAVTYAFWIVNLALLIFSALLLWTNVWTSPHHGQCTIPSVTEVKNGGMFNVQGVFPESRCEINPQLLFDLLFRSKICTNFGFVSGFPPMGWISFVSFGLLYGRILVHSSWKSSAVAGFNAVLSVIFAALFVSTRVLGYGNSSTDCLHTPDQERQAPGSNQYLASFKSFFYVTKYPPSPSYAFGTFAACFALLAILDLAALWHRLSRAKKVLLTYGTNALFYYAFHMIVINLFGMLLLSTPLAHPLPWAPDRRGVELAWPYWASYFSLLIVSYYACKHYAIYKASKGADSILRFL